MSAVDIEETNLLNLILNTINNFCLDFVQNPYTCYTEHGLHALFYSMLFNVLSEDQRYVYYVDKKVGIVQKEYQTVVDLDKSKRQHWDISILKEPILTSPTAVYDYDHLPLFAAIEFGMNEAKDHLEEDIRRLCHKNSNVDHPFIVHLYRLSASGKLFSARDWSSNSPRILNQDQVRLVKGNNPIEIFYGMADSTGKHENGVWRL